jgi:hypothetical protein
MISFLMQTQSEGEASSGDYILHGKSYEEARNCNVAALKAKFVEIFGPEPIDMCVIDSNLLSL